MRVRACVGACVCVVAAQVEKPFLPCLRLLRACNAAWYNFLVLPE